MTKRQAANKQLRSVAAKMTSLSLKTKSPKVKKTQKAALKKESPKAIRLTSRKSRKSTQRSPILVEESIPQKVKHTQVKTKSAFQPALGRHRMK
jgi:hypothetical protein